ncbi:MAG: hypothetical protein Q9217_001771 [Psora testacea]
MAEGTTHLLRPKPQRPTTYNLTPTSTSDSSAPSTPADFYRLDTSDASTPDTFVNRTRSVLNLTSSTLFGIYAPSDYDSNRVEPSTPLGNGSQTSLPRASVEDDKRPPVIGAYERPGLRRTLSMQHPHYKQRSYLSLLVSRIVLLFCFGVAYGVIISHLHDTQRVAPVQVQGIESWSWRYLMGWGGVGVILGGLLPWVDVFWEEVLEIDKDVFPSHNLEAEDSKTNSDEEVVDRPGSSSSSEPGLGADWNPVVRSIGAFVGIAFAIRKLPWQSTLQVSLTLALVNPVLWYLVDRSKPGFLLSLIVGLAGTAVAFGVNPEIVPAPAAPSPKADMGGDISHEGYGLMHGALISNESIGVGTWIASVLFCSSVCFGNIGRRLALGTAGRRGSVS